MEKNEKEKQMLYEWGKTNGADYHYPEIEQEKKSYFVQREVEEAEGAYIREYGFETLPELMKELNALWENEKVTESIKKAVGIAAIKNKPVEIIHKPILEDKKDKKEDRLPAFIYNF